jgi:hypothetical protein
MLKNSSLLILASALIMVTTALAAKPAEEAAPQVPAGWLAVDENVWNVLLDEPQEHFARARNYFDSADAELAADEMFRAAALVMIEAGRGHELQEVLSSQADKLQKVAHELRTGNAKKIVTAEKLNSVFATTTGVLARHYHNLAKDAKKRQERRAFGVALFATADYIAFAHAWAGEAVDESVVGQARSAANTILAGDGLLAGSGDTAIEQTEGQLEAMEKTWMKVDETLEQSKQVDN